MENENVFEYDSPFGEGSLFRDTLWEESAKSRDLRNKEFNRGSFINTKPKPFTTSQLGNNNNLQDHFKNLGNILNVFVYPSIKNIATMDNWAQAPGAYQVELQKEAKNLITAVYCSTPRELITELDKISKQGFFIGNLIIESHGHGSKGFYIGDYSKEASNVNFFNKDNIGNSKILKAVGKLIKGEIVLMGCQVGRNYELLVKLANTTKRNVIASEGWVSDWPAMFNDQSTSRSYMRYIVEFLFEHVEGFKEEIIDKIDKDTILPKWIIRKGINYFKKNIVEGVLDIFYSTVISPSGTADVIEDIGEVLIKGKPYYDPKRPLTKKELELPEIPPTMREMFEERVGQWRNASPGEITGGILDYYVPPQIGTFYFDKSGNPKFDRTIKFYQTTWGNAYKTLVEKLYSTKINSK